MKWIVPVIVELQHQLGTQRKCPDGPNRCDGPMTMLLHIYRPTQFHRTWDGANLSWSYNDRKDFDTQQKLSGRASWANYRPKQFQSTWDRTNPWEWIDPEVVQHPAKYGCPMGMLRRAQHANDHAVAHLQAKTVPLNPTCNRLVHSCNICNKLGAGWECLLQTGQWTCWITSIGHRFHRTWVEANQPSCCRVVVSERGYFIILPTFLQKLLSVLCYVAANLVGMRWVDTGENKVVWQCCLEENIPIEMHNSENYSVGSDW